MNAMSSEKAKGIEAVFPTSDRLIVVCEGSKGGERYTSGGILLPESVQKRMTKEGKVVAIGPGKVNEHLGPPQMGGRGGSLIPCVAQVGQTVIFNVYAGSEIDLNGKEALILNSHDVLAIKVEG